MKPTRIFLLAGVLFIFLFSSLSFAGVPQMINYQGKLTTPGGALIDSTLSMVFSIYDNLADVSPAWAETLMVQVEKGIFSVVLGNVHPLPNDLFDGTVQYLGVKAGTDPEMTPRKEIVSVAYARTDGDWTISGNDLYRQDGKVGIGMTTPNPASKLHVQHDSLYAGYFTSNCLNDSTFVIHSEFTGSGAYDASAVIGRSVPADYWGYGGCFEGGYMGVAGEVFPTGSGEYYGVWGYVYGGSGWNYGVRGEAHGMEENYGVCGYADGGVYDYAVYGNAAFVANSWAGYFVGNAKVVGTLTKGGGSFQIDHPLDPENKYLYHSFVESPDMKNVYDGVVTLDASGQATVQLPAYFEALNRDFRYQLTCIGGFAPVYIAQKIGGNQFTIAGGEPGMEVSWQVTGIRHDKFAEANRIQVEVDKPDNERGKYLHPEAYNLSEEYDIHYEQHKQMKEQIGKEKME